MYEQHFSDVSSQKNELKTALSEAQDRLNEALTRLEGVQKHALLEIDRARTGAQKQIEAMTLQNERVQKDYELSLASLTSQLMASRNEMVEIKQNVSSLIQENKDLKMRAERSETQADRLVAENTRLLGTVQQSLSVGNRMRNKRLKVRSNKT